MKKLLTLILFALQAIPTSAKEYDIYLLAGQSNMDGRGKKENLTSAQSKPFKKTIIFYQNPPHTSNGWVKLEPGFSIAPKYKGDLPSHTFGPEIGFANTLEKAEPKKNFAFIKVSKGGTSLRTDWKPGEKEKTQTQGPSYKNLLKAIDTATKQLKEKGHTYKIKGLIWHQGESDSKASTERHHTRLVELIKRIREDTKIKNLPFALGEVFDNGKRDNTRAAIQLTSKDDPYCGLVTSDKTTCRDAGTHFDAKSQLLIGNRYASLMLKFTRKF